MLSLKVKSFTRKRNVYFIGNFLPTFETFSLGYEVESPSSQVKIEIKAKNGFAPLEYLSNILSKMERERVFVIQANY